MIHGLEHVVAGTGTTVVHQIETEIFQIGLEMPHPVDMTVKTRLCTTSVILLLSWNTRTFLRRLYNLYDTRKKTNLKDLTKAPTKINGMTGRTLWDEIEDIVNSLSTEEGMDHQLWEVRTQDVCYKNIHDYC